MLWFQKRPVEEFGLWELFYENCWLFYEKKRKKWVLHLCINFLMLHANVSKALSLLRINGEINSFYVNGLESGGSETVSGLIIRCFGITNESFWY